MSRVLDEDTLYQGVAEPIDATKPWFAAQHRPVGQVPATADWHPGRSFAPGQKSAARVSM